MIERSSRNSTLDAIAIPTTFQMRQQASMPERGGRSGTEKPDSVRVVLAGACSIDPLSITTEKIRAPKIIGAAIEAIAPPTLTQACPRKDAGKAAEKLSVP